MTGIHVGRYTVGLMWARYWHFSRRYHYGRGERWYGLQVGPLLFSWRIDDA